MCKSKFPDGMEAEVPCRPAFDIDTPKTIQDMIRAGIPRTSIITAIMNNEQIDRQNAEGRYETEFKALNG